jgi:hypothetical protein
VGILVLGVIRFPSAKIPDVIYGPPKSGSFRLGDGKLVHQVDLPLPTFGPPDMRHTFQLDKGSATPKLFSIL